MGLFSALSAIGRSRDEAKAAGRVVTLRRRGENPVTVEQDPQPRYWDYWRALTGEHIDEEKAMRVPAVWAAVTLISSSIAALPVDVYQQIAGVSVEMDNPIARLLRLQPNPEMSAMSFWERLFFHEALWGNAYIFVVKSADGTPLQLWPLEPKRVEVGRDARGVKYYNVDYGSPVRPMFFDYAAGGEIVHVHGPSLDGLVGMSPVRQNKEAIALAIAAEAAAGTFFGDDLTPPGIIYSEKDVTPQQAKQLQELFVAQRRAAKHEPAFLGNGAKYQQMSFDPESSQLLEERRFQVSEMARIWKVPPHLLSDVEKSTSWGTGIEEQARNFVTFSLNPHILRFEHAININILKRIETDRYMKFNVNGLLRADTLKRYQTYEIAIGSRIMTPNEARALEERPPMAGGDEFPEPAAAPAARPAAEPEEEEAET